jgi:hypothetical protein
VLHTRARAHKTHVPQLTASSIPSSDRSSSSFSSDPECHFDSFFHDIQMKKAFSLEIIPIIEENAEFTRSFLHSVLVGLLDCSRNIGKMGQICGLTGDADDTTAEIFSELADEVPDIHSFFRSEIQFSVRMDSLVI